MTVNSMAEPDIPDDPLLTAYLDGELDAAERMRMEARLRDEPLLAARLERLRRGGEGIAPAVAMLSGSAPEARLRAMLARQLAGQPQARVDAAKSRRRWFGLSGLMQPWRPVAALASLVLVALVAGGVGYGLALHHAEVPAERETWLQAVAEYWRFTTAETLALAPSADLATSQLRHASTALGLPLAPAMIAAGDAPFRGAQLYAFEGKPLVQIAYLDPDYGPIAFCIIRNGTSEDSAATATEIEGFSVVHWQQDGYGRMLIGRAPVARLEALADRLKAGAGQGA
jgi:anti-sigma factor RsiW